MLLSILHLQKCAHAGAQKNAWSCQAFFFRPVKCAQAICSSSSRSSASAVGRVLSLQ